MPVAAPGGCGPFVTSDPHRAHCNNCSRVGATPSSREILAFTRNGTIPTTNEAIDYYVSLGILHCNSLIQNVRIFLFYFKMYINIDNRNSA